MKQNQVVMISILFMVAAFVMAAYIYNSQQSENQFQQVSKNSEALSKPHSPRKGNPNAKVTIVEFMDPACETCRQFHPFVKELMAKHPGRINLVIRYAPFHKGSDQMVKILHVAKQQGQFWNVLDLMFETQPDWASHHNPQPEVFWKVLERYGFDIKQLKEQVMYPALNEVIRLDMNDGQLLGATKTPTFFVNGKPMPSFGYQQLVDLVETEIASNYPD